MRDEWWSPPSREEALRGGRRRFLWRVGVLWLGMPVALAMVLIKYVERFGFTAAGLREPVMLIYALVWLAVVGLGGGLFLGWLFWWVFLSDEERGR